MSRTETKKANKPKFSVAITTSAYQTLINNTLGDPERAKRFVASITAAVAVNPALQECTSDTILAGALLGESLNLQPSPQFGHYFLIPFDITLKDENGKKIATENGNFLTEKRAQFVIGYKGYLQMAMRSGFYAFINVLEIKKGEFISFDLLTEEFRYKLIENEDERDAAETVGYVAIFRYKDGFSKTLYWTKKKMLNFSDTYAPGFTAANYKKIQNGEIPDKDLWKYSSRWYTAFDEMAKKTMLRQLIGKWGLMSSEMSRAFESDGRLINMDESGNFSTLEVPRETPPLIQPNTPIVPEATSVVKKINLEDV